MTLPAALLVILILLLFSAFFSASEIALNSANRIRLRHAAENGSRAAALTEKIIDNFKPALSAILIGNTLVNIAASSTATVAVMALIVRISGHENDGLASAISTVVMTLVVLTFGEIVPKIVAKENADTFAPAVAFPVRVVMLLLYPLVWLVTLLVSAISRLWGKDHGEDAPTVTEEELSTIIETVEEEGVIDEDKSELLQSTLDFKDTTVAEILTPRIDLVSIDADDDFETIEQVADGSRFSRIPVYEDSIDHIIGILSLNHFYKAKLENDTFDIRPILLEPQVIHKTMRLPAALELMKKTHGHIAVVIDEFGGTLGIVTMEDILEELVGEIWDESDEIVLDIVPVGENTFEVSGDMNIEDFFDEIEFEDRDFESEYTTVGGWCVEMLDAEPEVGRGFDYKNLTVTVIEMDDFRVTKARVFVEPVPEEED